MARLWYGAQGGDTIAKKVTDPDASGGLVYAPETAIFEAMTTRTGSTQHTDLLSSAGAAITVVTPDADGRVQFQGVDGYKGSYWLRNQASPSTARWEVLPAGLPERVIAIEGGSYYTLPGGGIPQADLDAATETKLDNAVPKTIFDAAGDLVIGTGSDAYARLAKGTASQQLRVKADATTLEWFTPASTATPNVDDLGDVDATTPPNGALLQFDDSDNLWHATDASTIFAQVGADGRLAAADNPQGFIPQQIINPGGSLATWTTPGSLVWVRSTVASALAIDSVGTGNNAASNSATQTATNSLTFSAGDYAIVTVAMSAEATFPTSVTATGPTNIGAMTQVAPITQGTTVASYIFYAKATGSVATSQTFTVTATGGTASRSDWAIRVIRLQGITGTSPVDVSSTNGGASQSSWSVGPTATTTQPSGIAIASVAYPIVTSGTMTPTSGWTRLGTVVQNSDATPKANDVVYKILTASGTQTAGGTFVNPCVWAGSLAVFKGA